MHVIHAFTASAADVAAPHKLTFTALDTPDHMCVVTSAAAQQVAATGATGRAAAAASSGARHAPAPVLHAVVWRPVEVDELLFGDWKVPWLLPLCLRLRLPRPIRHLDTELVLLLQKNANTLKWCHRPPACLHRTRARDTVTAAVGGHGPFDGLEEETDHLVCLSKRTVAAGQESMEAEEESRRIAAAEESEESQEQMC